MCEARKPRDPRRTLSDAEYAELAADLKEAKARSKKA
jgi:hypothetical protein